MAMTTMLAASLAATAGGAYMNNRAQNKSMRQYNTQVTQQNKLLSDQFADKQRLMNQNKDSQARLFNEMGAAQDAEFQNQTRLADEKSRAFQEAVKDPVMVGGAKSPAFDQAVNDRVKMFTDTSTDLPGNFGVANSGGTENRVLRMAADKDKAARDAKSLGIATAQAKMAALGDADQAQGNLFRNLDVKMGDFARQADAGTRALSSKLRLPEYRMGALGNAMGEAAQTPYFRGQEPVYRTPNTLFGDVLTGLGQIGSSYVFKQPGAAGATAKPWINPDMPRM
jgi:hypothetical protein